MSVKYRASQRDERGAVALLVAASLVALVVAAGMVLDFGLVRMDRQGNKSASDAAGAAGLRGLDAGDGMPHSFRGACQALAYLVANRPDLADGLSGNWSRGNGTDVGDPCSSGALDNVTCVSSDLSTWAVYEGTSTDPAVDVTIKSGYLLSDGGFPEESMTSLASDGSAEGGCDQLAVIITERRTPGFGSLATNADLVSRVRTVGRVVIGEEGEVAVALVVLEQQECKALHIDGSNAKIHVLGFGESPGLIQVDSDGSECSTGTPVINVNSMTNTDAIVAHAAQTANPETGVTAPGDIGIYGLYTGALTEAEASVGVPRVWAGPPPGHGPEGRERVTRAPVHNDYASGVQAAMVKANTAWSAPGADVVVPEAQCTGASPPTPNASGIWYFDCPNVSYTGDVVLPNATKVVMRGQLEIKSGRYFAVPKATEFYVNRPASGTSPGITLKGQLRMHTFDTDGSTACSAVPTPTSRARLVVGSGSIKSEGSAPLFRVCDTTVIMMGGQSGGCLPSQADLPPLDSTLCTNGNIELAGNAAMDWTAPNLVEAGRTQAHQDDLEDLALWTESEDESSITGGGGMTLAGVFALPNAYPFNIGGGGTQNVRDSQYFTRQLWVRGNGTLELRPNPYNVTTVPYLDGFSLVR